MPEHNNSPEKFKITEEMKEKAKEMQSKLNSFKDKILKEFDKYILGITILVPNPQKINEEIARLKREENKSDEELKELREAIEVLIVVDDSDSKKMTKEELGNKLFKVIDNHALAIDKNIKPIVMLLSELRESMYDGKYSLLQEIAMGSHIYDPADLLAALRIAEVHKGMVLKKFDKYIVSYVAAGSLFRGEKSHDIDVYVIVDDTDVKKMSRYELRERLRNIIITQGFEAQDITGVKKQFHIQVYILTDFWESIKDANPVIFTFLRDGVPLYDRSVFMPWKLLLQMGRIKPSSEAIDMQMDVGDKLLERAKKKFLAIAMDDIYYSILNPSQAALMLYGVNPPTPKETIRLFEEILAKKEKLIEIRYVRILEKAVKIFKDIEHGKIVDLTGTQLDSMIKDADLYIKRVKRLFDQIEKRRESESIVEVYNACLNASKDILKEESIKFTEQNLEKTLGKYFKKNGVNEKYALTLSEIRKAKKDFQLNKLSKSEAEKVRKDARIFLRTITDIMQRKKLIEVERSKIRFSYKDKTGEILFLEKVAFLTKDINEKEKNLLRIDLDKERNFGEVYNSNNQELEDYMKDHKSTIKVVINERLIKQISKIVGSEIEITLY